MNAPAHDHAQLEQRLARLCTTLDAAPGFETRLAARLAAGRAAPDPAARAQARERLLRERAAALGALERRLRSSLVLTAGGAVAASGPAWICGRWLAAVLGSLPPGASAWLAIGSAAALLGWLAAVLARLGRGERGLAA
jgi:hypothetical protein